MAKHRNTPYVPTQIRGLVFERSDVLHNMAKYIFAHILPTIKSRVDAIVQPSDLTPVSTNNLTGRISVYSS